MTILLTTKEARGQVRRLIAMNVGIKGTTGGIAQSERTKVIKTKFELRNHENEDLGPTIEEEEIVDEPMVDVVKIRTQYGKLWNLSSAQSNTTAKIPYTQTSNRFEVAALSAKYEDKKVDVLHHVTKMGTLLKGNVRAPKNKEGRFRYQDNTRKQGNNEDTSSKTMLAIDGVDLMGKPQQDDTGFIDSGCLRHMTENIAYLSDFFRLIGGCIGYSDESSCSGIGDLVILILRICSIKNGIKREYSVARTPQQNGVAKRKNRTLIEVARTMLVDFKLPTTFWAKAVSTACYCLPPKLRSMAVTVKPRLADKEPPRSILTMGFNQWGPALSEDKMNIRDEPFRVRRLVEKNATTTHANVKPLSVEEVVYCGVSKIDFDNYVKANDAVLKNVENQGQNLQNQMANVTSLLTSLCNNFNNSASTSKSGPSTPLVPTPVVSIPLKEPEQNLETSMDKVQKPSSESTAQVPPLEEEDSIFIEIPKPKAKKTVNVEIQDLNSPRPNSYQSKLPYPERMKVREIDKPGAQHSRFLKMFKQLRLEIRLKDALVEMLKFNKWLSSLLRNKEKLKEIAITTVNAECSAIIMNTVPEKLEDQGKFLITCSLQELDRTSALAYSGASINLLPHSIYKQLGLGALKPTRMTLELANRFVTHPMGITEDVVVRVDGFTFLADFVVETLTLRVGKEELVYYADKSKKNEEKKFVHAISIIDFSKDDPFSGITIIPSDAPFPSSSPMKTSDSTFEEITDEFILPNSLPPGNDVSIHKKDIHEETFRIYSNPLFEFDDNFKSSNVNPLFEEKDKDVEIKSSPSFTLTSPEESELIWEDL
ncbi:reverse transcriptase domain-containing protein [Tanacetum coccineum]